MKDFVFNKEVKMGKYLANRGKADESGTSRALSLPPHACVAYANMLDDPASEPPYRWRVPYVVIYKANTSTLKDLVIEPQKLLVRGSDYKLNLVNYYIPKQINPALRRVIDICGGDIDAWYTAMPKQRLRSRIVAYESYRPNTHQSNSSSSSKGAAVQTTLRDYFATTVCYLCNGEVPVAAAGASMLPDLCSSCMVNQCSTMSVLHNRLSNHQREESKYRDRCNSCVKTHPQISSMFELGKLIGTLLLLLTQLHIQLLIHIY